MAKPNKNIRIREPLQTGNDFSQLTFNIKPESTCSKNIISTPLVDKTNFYRTTNFSSSNANGSRKVAASNNNNLKEILENLNSSLSKSKLALSGVGRNTPTNPAAVSSNISFSNNHSGAAAGNIICIHSPPQRDSTQVKKKNPNQILSKFLGKVNTPVDPKSGTCNISAPHVGKQVDKRKINATSDAWKTVLNTSGLSNGRNSSYNDTGELRQSHILSGKIINPTSTKASSSQGKNDEDNINQAMIARLKSQKVAVPHQKVTSKNRSSPNKKNINDPKEKRNYKFKVDLETTNNDIERPEFWENLKSKIYDESYKNNKDFEDYGDQECERNTYINFTNEEIYRPPRKEEPARDSFENFKKLFTNNQKFSGGWINPGTTLHGASRPVTGGAFSNQFQGHAIDGYAERKMLVSSAKNSKKSNGGEVPYFKSNNNKGINNSGIAFHENTINTSNTNINNSINQSNHNGYNFALNNSGSKKASHYDENSFYQGKKGSSPNRNTAEEQLRSHIYKAVGGTPQSLEKKHFLLNKTSDNLNINRDNSRDDKGSSKERHKKEGRVPNQPQQKTEALRHSFGANGQLITKDIQNMKNFIKSLNQRNELKTILKEIQPGDTLSKTYILKDLLQNTHKERFNGKNNQKEESSPVGLESRNQDSKENNSSHKKPKSNIIKNIFNFDLKEKMRASGLIDERHYENLKMKYEEAKGEREEQAKGSGLLISNPDINLEKYKKVNTPKNKLTREHNTKSPMRSNSNNNTFTMENNFFETNIKGSTTCKNTSYENIKQKLVEQTLMNTQDIKNQIEIMKIQTNDLFHRPDSGINHKLHFVSPVYKNRDTRLNIGDVNLLNTSNYKLGPGLNANMWSDKNRDSSPVEMYKMGLESGHQEGVKTVEKIRKDNFIEEKNQIEDFQTKLNVKDANLSALNVSKNDKFGSKYIELENGSFATCPKTIPPSDKTSKFKEEYLVGKVIGQGAYASVRVALHKPTNNKVAIKIYEKSRIKEPQRRKSVKREIKLLKKMNHENIIRLYDTFETNNHVNLIMEYMGGTSLHSHLKAQPNRKLPEKDAKRIFKQILSAVQYCHNQCIAHRDIKLENILLDEKGSPKLIDFGFSTCIPNDKKVKMYCGTPSYMAPEIVLKQEYCGPPADIWALGVLLFALLSGTFPFRGSNDKELYKRIIKGEYSMAEGIPEKAKKIIENALSVDPDQRPTVDEILNSGWLREDYDSDYTTTASNKHEESTLRIGSDTRTVKVRNFLVSNENVSSVSSGLQNVPVSNINLQNRGVKGNGNVCEAKARTPSPYKYEDTVSFNLNQNENRLNITNNINQTNNYYINNKNIIINLSNNNNEEQGTGSLSNKKEVQKEENSPVIKKMSKLQTGNPNNHLYDNAVGHGGNLEKSFSPYSIKNVAYVQDLKASGSLRNSLKNNIPKAFTSNNYIPPPQQKTSLRSFGSTKNLIKVNEDLPEKNDNFTSFDSDVIKSLIKMGFDDEDIACQLREPDSEIMDIYKKIYEEKKYIKRAIYPSHAPSLMTLFGSYSKSPSTSTNVSQARFGRKKGNLNCTASGIMGSSFNYLDHSGLNASCNNVSFLNTSDNNKTAGNYGNSYLFNKINELTEDDVKINLGDNY